MHDDYAIVLDFLPKGRAIGKGEPLAQVVGDKFFSLLEVVIRKDTAVKHGERLYIGNEERKEVDHIKRRIKLNELTNFAKSELMYIVENIVDNNEQRFVSFFNTAQPISTRLHQFELLPGIGKKHMWDLIAERKGGNFTSFEDIHARIKLLPDPRNMIIKRIMEEIENEHERYRLFVLGMPRQRY